MSGRGLARVMWNGTSVADRLWPMGDGVAPIQYRSDDANCPVHLQSRLLRFARNDTGNAVIARSAATKQSRPYMIRGLALSLTPILPDILITAVPFAFAARLGHAVPPRTCRQ